MVTRNIREDVLKFYILRNILCKLVLTSYLFVFTFQGLGQQISDILKIKRSNDYHIYVNRKFHNIVSIHILKLP